MEDDSKFTVTPNEGFLSRIILLKSIFLKNRLVWVGDLLGHVLLAGTSIGGMKLGGW